MVVVVAEVEVAAAAVMVVVVVVALVKGTAIPIEEVEAPRISRNYI